MAKKKSTPKKPEPPATPPGIERLSVLNLKGSPEYRDWLNTISKETLIPATAIVRDALAKWAKDRGLVPPPEL